MLQCPFCHEQVKPQGRDNWFECPACQNFIRLRVNQNGSRWLEAGYYANEAVHPLHFSRQASPPARSSVEQRSKASRANIRTMNRGTVQTERQWAAAKLSDLEQNIQRVINLRSQNLKNEQMTSQYNTQLSRYTREQNDWQLYERQLAEREHQLLEEEREQARQARKSGGMGLAFWFGAILSGAGIYAFSQLMGLQLDLMGYLFLVLIALISGFVTLIITKVD
jgi:hypothetical protein